MTFISHTSLQRVKLNDGFWIDAMCYGFTEKGVKKQGKRKLKVESSRLKGNDFYKQ
jgi:hypothetical protein